MFGGEVGVRSLLIKWTAILSLSFGLLTAAIVGATVLKIKGGGNVREAVAVGVTQGECRKSGVMRI